MIGDFAAADTNGDAKLSGEELEAHVAKMAKTKHKRGHRGKRGDRGHRGHRGKQN